MKDMVERGLVVDEVEAVNWLESAAKWNEMVTHSVNCQAVIVSQFQSFLHYWSTSVESATYINPSNGQYCDVQVPSKN